MYKFPEDLDLNYLIGSQVTQVTIAPYNLLFVLEPEDHINVCGKWRILDGNGKTIDEGILDEEKDSYKAHKLLNKTIKAYKVQTPTKLSFQFEDGWILEIIDDNEKYETVHISPNIYI